MKHPEEASIKKVLIKLNNMLEDELSLQIISFEFDKVAELLKYLKIKIELHFTREYCFDEEINTILQMKRRCKTSRDAINLKKKELELIKAKPNDETIIIRQEPSAFEYKKPNIIAYLNKKKTNEYLLAVLIIETGLLYLKPHF